MSGSAFYNPQITDASRVIEPRIMPGWVAEKQEEAIKNNTTSDTTGLILKVFEEDENRKEFLLEKFEDCLEESFQNSNSTSTIEVTVDMDSGKVFLEKAVNSEGKNMKMDKYQRRAYRQLEKVINNKKYLIPIHVADRATAFKKH